jgi:pimeloyl-ACP methyl ester carboxylesterase
MNEKPAWNFLEQTVIVEQENIRLEGELVIPQNAKGIVVFGLSSGSNRYSSRNRYLAHLLRQHEALATLIIDLLTPEEDIIDQRTQHFRGDLAFLATRLVAVTDWLLKNPITNMLKIGYFAADMSSGAVFLAVTSRPMTVGAIACRSGYTDLVSETLPYIQTPTLLIVGGEDLPLIAMNEDAFKQIACENKQLEIIAGATHQFSEPGAWEEVARLASQWFKHHLNTSEQKELHLHAMPLN